MKAASAAVSAMVVRVVDADIRRLRARRDEIVEFVTPSPEPSQAVRDLIPPVDVPMQLVMSHPSFTFVSRVVILRNCGLFMPHYASESLWTPDNAYLSYYPGDSVRGVVRVSVNARFRLVIYAGVAYLINRAGNGARLENSETAMQYLTGNFDTPRFHAMETTWIAAPRPTQTLHEE